MHFTNDLTENAEGWWPAVCECGWQGGMYPSPEDAADGLMQHAYEAGWLDATSERDVSAEAPASEAEER